MWTVENELMRLSRTRSLRDAFVALGLSSTNIEPRVQLTEPWIRGGAETYICRFRIEDGDVGFKDFLFKACVAFSPGSSIEKIVDTWLLRRSLLKKAGIGTPRLLCSNDGVILEQFIPYELGSALVSANAPTRRHLLKSLGQLAAVLQSLRFAAIDPYSDMRTDGTHTYCIDFGEDLGPPNQAITPRENLAKLWKALETWRVSLTESERTDISRAYECSMFTQ